MRSILIYILLIITCSIYAQDDTKPELNTNDDYSTWLSESLSKLSDQLDLIQLKEVQQGLNYRVWFEGQVIEISSNAEDNHEGSITNFANTASFAQSEEIKSYSTSEKIDAPHVNQLLALLNKYEKIDYQNVWRNEKWEIDKVKLLFVIETSSNGSYSIEEVWIPKQDSDIKEVSEYKQFTDSCSELLDLNKKFESFFDNLPNGCYVTSVHTFRCKNDEKSTRANQWLLSAQPIDSMLYYLNNQDWSFMASANDWIFHNNILVSFSKKGKINNVKYEIQSGTIYQDDLYSKDMRQLKKQIKKSLMNLDFSLFNPPESYSLNIALTYNSSNGELNWSNW